MPPIPHERTLDSSLALLAEGYTVTGTWCQSFQLDIFFNRLMLQKDEKGEQHAARPAFRPW